MSDPVSTFFDAWELSSAEERRSKIAEAVAPNITYDDPRTPETITGIEGLSDYVGMFSENAPGWTAKVVANNTTAGMTRATVAFAGKGPDGSDIVQLGQYFVETEDGLVSRMVGFPGMGAPE